MLYSTAVFWCAMLRFLAHPKEVFGYKPNSRRGCQNNREELGFALVGHDFKSVHADNFARCYFKCSLEERCQSVTFLWSKKECQMKKETKKSRPGDFVENPAATYMENNFRAQKGSTPSFPGSSCKDIPISGEAQGDGEYWIDATSSGDPFRVFCDMTTDQGGWTLISRFLMKDLNSPRDATVESDSYREILSSHSSNKHYLLRAGFNQLKNDMAFTQIRFYCFKKKAGRVFHIMTNNDAKGAKVVEFFTESDTRPEACDSFTRLPDDNSTLARNCNMWGYFTTDRWGHSSFLDDVRLYLRPVFWKDENYYAFYFQDNDPRLFCDDRRDENAASLGDTWHIFVR